MINKFKRFLKKAIEPVMNEGGFLDAILGDTPDAPEYPEMTPQEMFLISLMTGQLTGNLQDIEAMSPLLLEQMGVEKVPVELSPEDAAKKAELEKKISGLEGEISKFQNMIGSKTGLQGKAMDELANKALAKLNPQLQTAKMELGTIGPEYTYQMIPLTPEQQETKRAAAAEETEIDTINAKIRELTLKSLNGELPGQKATDEINRLVQERTLAALKGELPISPALERDIAEGEKNIEGSLSQRLGPNWMLSTPGIQTMGRFDETALIARDAARRGELAQSFPMLLQGQGLSQGYTGANMPLLTSGTNLGLGLGSFAAGENQRLLSNLSSYPTMGSGLYGVYPSLMQPYQMQRQGQFQSDLAQYNADVASQMALTQGLFGLGGLLGYGYLTRPQSGGT